MRLLEAEQKARRCKMGILKGFMIFGAIIFMLLAFVESNSKKCLIKDLSAMAVCSAIAVVIELLF